MIHQISDLCFWNYEHMPDANYLILDAALRMWCEDNISGEYYPMSYVMEASLKVELE